MKKTLKEIYGIREMSITVPDEHMDGLRKSIIAGVKHDFLPPEAKQWISGAGKPPEEGGSEPEGSQTKSAPPPTAGKGKSQNLPGKSLTQNLTGKTSAPEDRDFRNLFKHDGPKKNRGQEDDVVNSFDKQPVPAAAPSSGLNFDDSGADAPGPTSVMPNNSWGSFSAAAAQDIARGRASGKRPTAKPYRGDDDLPANSFADYKPKKQNADPKGDPEALVKKVNKKPGVLSRIFKMGKK